MDSSPGYPWVMLGSTNEEVLKNNGLLVWDCVETRMTYIRDNFERIQTMSPEELVKFGVCDPVKIFIKKEPHSSKKVATGMYRIIASVSICDQIVTRLTAFRQNKAEIANWRTCPSKPGLGLNDQGLAILAARFKEILTRHNLMETDVSSWDWTVQDWELRMDAKARNKLAGKSDDSTFGKLNLVHAYVVANSVFVTCDGAMFAQVIPGGQLSGCYNTSSTNSRMRVLLSMVSRHMLDPMLTIEFSKNVDVESMGDDTVEAEVPGIKVIMEDLGHIVKQVAIRTQLAGLEFCSQTFREDGTAYPTDPHKTFFRYLSHPVDDSNYPAYMAQLMYYFRHMEPGKLESFKQTALKRVERLRNL